MSQLSPFSLPSQAGNSPAEPLLASATQLLREGRPSDAIAPLREASRLLPSHAVIQHDLGLACLEAGHWQDAAAAFQQAVMNDPGYADAHLRLGIVCEKLGHTHDALAAYHGATEADPFLTEAWFRAGALAYTLGYRDEAIGCFRRAAATGGKTSFGRLGSACALLTEGLHREAERVLRKTITADPQNAMAQELLGNLLSEFGRFDEARECFERAITLAPLLAGSYYELVRCRPLTGADDGLLQSMTAALETPGLEAAQRMRVHLAIGKAADDLGDYELAMRHLDAADSVRRETVPFDAAAFSRLLDAIISLFNREWMERLRRFGSPDARPVLIIGMPRSGTTLAEQILSMHPEVAAAGELNSWAARGNAFLRPGANHEDGEFFAQAAFEYLRVLRAVGPKAKRITDKMPFNFLWAGLIHTTFPNATFIHCRRAAIDTALSIHQTHFSPSMAFPTGGVELVDYFRGYHRLMEHWRDLLPPERFLEVDYQDLTREPEPVIRFVVESCGLRWHDGCLCPEKNPRAVNTPSKWQTRQPIYRTSVARWRRYEPYLGALRALVDPADEPR